MLLKELNNNYFFDRKNIIEYSEDELTGAPKETSDTDNSVVAEEENVDEAITADSKASNDMENDIKEEQNT